jgi:AcrR family transcriptional regulator
LVVDLDDVVSERSEARERVLDAAELLFAGRGYASVTVKDIAQAVGIRHTTLYHHAPGGKAQLFIEVTERHLQRHRDGIEHAIRNTGGDVRQSLYAIADWLLSQPPLDFMRLTRLDLETMPHGEALRIAQLALDSTIEPIARVLAQAQVRGEIHHADIGLVAGGIFGMIESLHMIPDHAAQPSRAAMARVLIDTFLDGLLEQHQ